MPFCTVDGVELYYEAGPPGKPALLLLNGLTMTTAAWGLQTPVFSEHFRTLCMDFRGQGKSARPEASQYALSRQADDCAGLLDALQIESADVIGLSYGGMVAQHLAVRHPARVRRLVLADTLAWSDSVNRQIADSWQLAIEAGGRRLQFELSLPLVFGHRYLAANPAVIQLLREQAAMADWEPVRRLTLGVLDHDLRQQLASLACPTLIAVGAEDRFTPYHHAQLLSSLIPGARLEVIPDCGHASPLENPKAFNQIVLTFLR